MTCICFGERITTSMLDDSHAIMQRTEALLVEGLKAPVKKSAFTPYKRCGPKVWLGKAVPRVWLSDGETVVVTAAPTAYGAISVTLTSAVETTGTIAANVTVPPGWASGGAPAGGLILRARAPSGHRLLAVTVGGQAWSIFNSTAETMAVPAASIPAALAGLSTIVFHYK